MGINQIPGVGPTNADIASAVAAPSAATIAAAVAAPSANTIASAVAAVVPNPFGITVQATYNTSTNNATASNNFVYALVAGGGAAGQGGGPTANGSPGFGAPAGGVVFGLTPKSSTVIIGAGGTAVAGNAEPGNRGFPSRYGFLRAQGGGGTNISIQGGNIYASYNNTVDGQGGPVPLGGNFAQTVTTNRDADFDGQSTNSFGRIYGYGSIMPSGSGTGNYAANTHQGNGSGGMAGGGGMGGRNASTASIPGNGGYSFAFAGGAGTGASGGGGGGGGGIAGAGAAGSGINGGAGGAGGGGGGGGGGGNTGGGIAGAGGSGAVIIYY